MEMPGETVAGLRTIDWAVASRELPGQNVCGDCHIIKAVDGGVLASVMDGLGHGEEARVAVETAARIIEEHSDWPLEWLIRRCHEALAHTRGAVMTLVRLNVLLSELTWLGIGNVEAVLFRASSQTTSTAERAVLHSGLVGYRLTQVQPDSVSITPGDLLIIVTDGIALEFHKTLVRSDSPQQIADGILKRHFKGNDDALVLVLRYVGDGQA
jgi:phosphoserine phosphatase RsbX